MHVRWHTHQGLSLNCQKMLLRGVTVLAQECDKACVWSMQSVACVVATVSVTSRFTQLIHSDECAYSRSSLIVHVHSLQRDRRCCKWAQFCVTMTNPDGPLAPPGQRGSTRTTQRKRVGRAAATSNPPELRAKSQQAPVCAKIHDAHLCGSDRVMAVRLKS